jgi:oligopeptide transport system permease protein
MGRYLIRRFCLSFISFFILAGLCFVLLRLFPGGPFDQDNHLAPRVLESMKVQYGLADSLPRQLFLFLKNLLFLDLGPSILHSGKAVNQVIAEAWPQTLALGGLSLILSIFFGFIIGVGGFSIKSHFMTQTFHLFLLSVPTLFLAPTLIFLFGFWFNWLPVTVNERMISYILPLAVLTVKPAASLGRLLHGALSETILQPWVTTARAYGLSETLIFLKYAMRISLIPALSYLGSVAASVLSGSILVEMIFNIHGLGSLFIESLINRDYPLITGLTLTYGFLLIVTTLAADLLMYRMDPRMERA